MLALGIDPGLVKTGIALLEYNEKTGKYSSVDYKFIKIYAKQPLEKRLNDLKKEVLYFIESLMEGGLFPNFVGIEKTLCNINAVSSILLAEARGTIMSVLGGFNFNVIECHPVSVKRILTKDPNADKEKVKLYVSKLSGGDLLFPGHDVYDAFAIAYCSIHSDKVITDNIK